MECTLVSLKSNVTLFMNLINLVVSAHEENDVEIGPEDIKGVNLTHLSGLCKCYTVSVNVLRYLEVPIITLPGE